MDGQVKDVRRGKGKETGQHILQQYEYNARGQIIGIVDGNQNKISYDTDSWGRITGISFADGVREDYTLTQAVSAELRMVTAIPCSIVTTVSVRSVSVSISWVIWKSSGMTRREIFLCTSTGTADD